MTNIVKTTYVEYEFRGIYDGQTRVNEVDDRDVHRETLGIPKYGIAFRYFDIVTTTVEVDGQLVELSSERINESILYYVDATVMSISELRAAEFSKSYLDYMDQAGIQTLIRSRLGDYDFVAFDSAQHELVSTN